MFYWFVIAVSVAMAWIVLPFFGAILWALVATIVFWPIHRRIVARFPHRRNVTASLTLLLIVLIVIVPLLTVGALLIDQAVTLYNSLENRQIDMTRIFAQVRAGLPDTIVGLLDRAGFRNWAGIEARLGGVVTGGARLVAAQAVSIGQSAFNLFISLSVMLYLSFFLLRDGPVLTRRIGERIPMDSSQRRDLFGKFATVTRATVKGSVVVAVVQGSIGGCAFALLGIPAALLWGVVMAFLSLVPAIGAGLVWVPFAIYLFATGDMWSGGFLVFTGIAIIGSVDNLLRPILVGADTRMPDWVVLISTLGGISVMGFNGIVVGPVIAAMFIAAWDSFLEQRKSMKDELAKEGVE